MTIYGRKRSITKTSYVLYLPSQNIEEMGFVSIAQARRFYIENAMKGDEPGIIDVVQQKKGSVREDYAGEIGFSRKGGYYFTDGYLVWGVARDGKLIASSMRKARK